MRLILRLLCVGILVFPMSAWSVQKKVALVIGNSHYAQAETLPNPVRDADAMVKALQQLGFKVLPYLDVKRQDMRYALRAFKRELSPGAVAVFFYAGHGIQVGRENYLLPVDTDIAEEYEVPDEGLSLSSVLRAIRAADTKLGIVMLDACRNNPFERSIRGATRSTGEGQGLAAVDAVRGTLLSYATQPGNVAVDGAGEHSPYTKALLRFMLDPGLTVQDMFNRVGLSVLEQTKYQQEPWLSVSPIPNFCFAGCENPLQLTAQDGVEAQQRLLRFQRLFESADLDGLSKIAVLTKTQQAQLEFLFKRYKQFDVDLQDLSVHEKAGNITAKIHIADALDATGNRILPAKSWRNFIIELKKSQDGWSKISWQ